MISMRYSQGERACIKGFFLEILDMVCKLGSLARLIWSRLNWLSSVAARFYSLQSRILIKKTPYFEPQMHDLLTWQLQFYSKYFQHTVRSKRLQNQQSLWKCLSKCTSVTYTSILQTMIMKYAGSIEFWGSKKYLAW